MTTLAHHAGGGTIVLEPVAGGAPLWRHCGVRVAAGELPALADTRTAASYSLDRDCPLSTAPVPATGWIGPPAVALRRDGVALPLYWTEGHVSDDDGAIRIVCRDLRAGVELVQTWRVEAGLGWCVGAAVINRGSGPVSLDWLASVLVPLSGSADREVVEALPGQAWLRESRRGISGHGGAPGVYVLNAGAGWHAGEVLAMQMCWSGDSRIAIERDDEGFHILSAGAVLQPGEVVLAPGESWSAPDALLAISGDGRNGAMAAQHAMVRAMLRWPGGAMSPRKVHLNSWEACYFDHDATRIETLARAAAAVGIERFVLDDGSATGLPTR